jgi:hypothetical protein
MLAREIVPTGEQRRLVGRLAYRYTRHISYLLTQICPQDICYSDEAILYLYTSIKYVTLFLLNFSLKFCVNIFSLNLVEGKYMQALQSI